MPNAHSNCRGCAVGEWRFRRHHSIGNVPVILRINAAGSLEFADDIEAMRGAAMSHVMMAKAQSISQFNSLCDALGSGCRIIALIETARCPIRAQAIAEHRSVVKLAFGAKDFALDVNCALSSLAVDPGRAAVGNGMRKVRTFLGVYSVANIFLWGA